jgi:uncharacterized membrane protein
MSGDASDFTNAIREINENASNIFGKGMTPDQLIGYQQEVNNYINSETSRLQEKQDSVTSARYSQMRAVELNDNHRKRTAAFNHLIIVTCLVIFGVLVINLAKSFITFIPGFIFDVFIGILLTFVIIYDIYMYQDMRTRTPTDFDKLQVSPPTIVTSDPSNTAPTAASAGGSGTGLGIVCIGAACCDTDAGMTYDTKSNRCVSSISGFTPMNTEPQPNAPFEFSKYILYNQL